MQIVIEIPDNYDFSKIQNGSIASKIILNAVANGTPLPKGYGRLIDAREYENSIRKHYFDNATVIRCTEIALGNAPTIIEADKAGKEKKNEDNSIT